MKFFYFFVLCAVLVTSVTSVTFLGYTWFAHLGSFPWIEGPRAICTISIQQDLHPNAPLLLNSTKAYYFPKNKYGDISFTQADTLNLACPSGEVLINGKTTAKTILPVRCQGQKVFQVIGGTQTAALRSFSCTKLNTHVARYTGKPCLKNFSEIEIGYQVETLFLRDLTICFDKFNQTTAYSAYNLSKAIGGNQFNIPRPQFVEGTFFNTGKHQVNNLYTQYVQRINVNKQLGLPETSKKYIGTGDYFLSRGHLTARADFVYGHQQNATFYYVNAAPQWQTFNEGNWNELEKSVRKYAGDKNLDLVVYTGTHGVATLPHETTHKDIPIHLYIDNGKRGIPVPRIYWKIVYEPRTKSGIAFVGLNNPYQKAISVDVLCTDICSKVTWDLSWNRTNITQGYGYCCNVDDLRKRVNNIPNLVVNSVLV